MLEKDRDKFDIPASTKFDHVEARRAQKLERFDFDGTLDWFQPLDECWPEGLFAGGNYIAATPEEMESLLKEAEEKGVVIPPPLVQFFTDPRIVASPCLGVYELQGNDPVFGIKFHSIIDLLFVAHLARVSATIDKGAGGCVLEFCFPMGPTMDSMAVYIEPGPEGKYCVLRWYQPSIDWGPTGNPTAVKKYEAFQAVAKERVELAKRGQRLAYIISEGVHLDWVGLEEWLFMRHFESWMVRICYDPHAKPTKALKEYVRVMYGCEGV
ncbi:hypothetical protein N0V90_001760 [Kalmusia sp. IMI 367209]|nr:hypothetical protein N0V90_001760 [Kalmusia sp. IMI 367209]